jgi:hypothetical protein
MLVDQIPVLGQQPFRKGIDVEEPRVEHLLGIGPIAPADEFSEEGDFST